MKRIFGNDGMTMTELMVVLAIVGILAALAVPSYIGMMPKFRANGAARVVSSDLQMARMRAISENTLYVVDFDPANNSYVVYKSTNATTLAHAAETATYKQKSVNITTGNKGIVFGQNASGPPSDITDGTFGSGTKVKFVDPFDTTTTKTYIVFRPNGSALYSGAVYLAPAEDISTGRHDRNRAITVQAFSGYVKSWSGDTGGVWIE